jgi:hypothetical protein
MVPPVAVAPGNVLFSLTTTDAVPEHEPFDTVRLYVPDVEISGFCNDDVKFPGPFQLYVTPDVLELPASVTEVLVQVRGPLTPAVAVIFEAPAADTFTLSI